MNNSLKNSIAILKTEFPQIPEKLLISIAKMSNYELIFSREPLNFTRFIFDTFFAQSIIDYCTKNDTKLKELRFTPHSFNLKTQDEEKRNLSVTFVAISPEKPLYVLFHNTDAISFKDYYYRLFDYMKNLKVLSSGKTKTDEILETLDLMIDTFDTGFYLTKIDFIKYLFPELKIELIQEILINANCDSICISNNPNNYKRHIFNYLFKNHFKYISETIQFDVSNYTFIMISPNCTIVYGDINTPLHIIFHDTLEVGIREFYTELVDYFEIAFIGSFKSRTFNSISEKIPVLENIFNKLEDELIC